MAGDLRATYAYAAQVDRLINRARAWLHMHRGEDVHVEIEFHFPPKVWVAATWEDAVATGLVTTNDAGDDLVRYMRAGEPPRRASTIGMVRAAIEVALEEVA